MESFIFLAIVAFVLWGACRAIMSLGRTAKAYKIGEKWDDLEPEEKLEIFDSLDEKMITELDIELGTRHDAYYINRYGVMLGRDHIDRDPYIPVREQIEEIRKWNS